MYWNHRVMQHKNGDLEIAEVMYGAFTDVDPLGPAGEFGWSDAKVYADADSEKAPMESLRTQVDWFKGALDKPTLPARGCEKSCCQDALTVRSETHRTTEGECPIGTFRST